MTTSAESRDFGKVDVAGPEDASPIVFVHGAVLNRTMWAPQREALAEEFRVIAPDLPGHGSRRDEPFRMEAALETVDDVIDRYTDGSAPVIGLSLGGYVATEFAHRHPEKVDSLVISGSSANPVGRLGTVTRVVGKITKLASKSGLAERATDWLAAKYVRSRDIEPERKQEIVDAGFDLRPYGEAGVEIAGEDFRSAFGSFSGPALIVNGKWDLIMRRGEKDHARAAGLDSVMVIDGAGHVCSLDRPDVYTFEIREFVESPIHITSAE